ncbi:hypothetical protein GCM10010307_31300 [Streptomyces vastus]|uniref:Uncharacterized protein n=1 Tax=Streptomyces vastus TaxID=285451 RepID=A0ABP6D6L7_9ACTN
MDIRVLSAVRGVRAVRNVGGAICARCALTCGKPGSQSSLLTRGSVIRARWSAYRVTSQGVPPFQIRTLQIPFSARKGSTAGGGARRELRGPVHRILGKRPARVRGTAGHGVGHVSPRWWGSEGIGSETGDALAEGLDEHMEADRTDAFRTVT